MSGAGWQVHGWRYPVVWWARRKPRSHVRQCAWSFVDYIDWKIRVRPMIRRTRAAVLRDRERTE